MTPRGKHEGPSLAEIEEAGREIGHIIGSLLPEGVGFALHLWSFGDRPGWATFVSNVDRKDHLDALREMISLAEEEEL
jgi:hypothetical protein